MPILLQCCFDPRLAFEQHVRWMQRIVGSESIHVEMEGIVVVVVRVDPSFVTEADGVAALVVAMCGGMWWLTEAARHHSAAAVVERDHFVVRRGWMRSSDHDVTMFPTSIGVVVVLVVVVPPALIEHCDTVVWSHRCSHRHHHHHHHSVVPDTWVPWTHRCDVLLRHLVTPLLRAIVVVHASDDSSISVHFVPLALPGE